jgi:hypothetical protein
MKKVSWVVCAVVAAAGLAGAGYLAGSSEGEKANAPSPATGSLPGVSDCGVRKPRVRPTSLTATCADAGILVGRIRWQAWLPSSAVGLATVSANDCEPDCADGSDISYAVEVVLDQPQNTNFGDQFTRMVVIFQGRAPGPKAEVFELPPYPTGG